ncbi:hypothetical protein ACFCVY_07805 [Streptomyces sp. NPDC056411]|uniref:hypothetical protein n=1 Tax=Streptomyces sp. NPDC056411 TaxID=3345813 RepID=UPI0035D66B5E
MSAVLALPAAVRIPRTVAARRALLAGLFLVGFVALGFAFGPGAHAADRTGSQALTGATSPAAASSEASLPDRAATRDGATDGADRLAGSRTTLVQKGKAARAELTEGAQTATGGLADTVRPAAERTAPVTGRLTDPVNRVVREIGDMAGAALPGQLPSGTHAKRPGDGAAHPHGRTPGDARQAGPRAGTADDAVTAHPAHCTAGPQHPAAGSARTVVNAQRDPGHQGLPGQLPQGPVAPAPHTAGDGHGPRGGDQHAAAPVDSPRFRLLPGGVRTAEGAPTRRRAEEILEFPG